MALDLKARVALDTSAFSAGLSAMEHQGKHAFENLKEFAVSAFGIYSVNRLFEKSVENARELVTAAQRLGSESTDDLQVLRQAAKEVNSDLGSVVGTLEKVRLARSKALAGDKGALAAFGALGVSPAQLKSMTAEQLFMGPISNAAKTLNPEDSAAAFKQILGKGFGEMLPLLKTDFDELREHMQALGTIIDTQTVKGLVAMEAELGLLSQIILAKLSPAIVAFAETLYKAMGGLASTAAALGGGTASWNGKDFLKAGLAFSGPLGNWLANLFPGLSPKPFDKEAAKAAGLDVFGGWEKGLEEIKDKIAKMLTAGKDDVNINVPSLKSASHARIEAPDALVRIGNMLGDSGASALTGIAERHLQETRAMHGTLREATRYLGRISANGTAFA